MTPLKALDCYVDAAPHIHELGADGYRVVFRYIFNSSAFKQILTRAEAQALSSAGLRIGTIWENGTPIQDSYFTLEAAQFDAAGAIAKATAIGQPQGTEIAFAYDGQISVDVAVRYARVVHDRVKAAGYLATAYGSGAVLQRLSELGLIHGNGWLSQSKGFPGWNAWQPQADVVQGPAGRWRGIDEDSDLVQDLGITWKL